MIFFKLNHTPAPSEEKRAERGGLHLSGDLGFSSILAILRMGILAEAHGRPRGLSDETRSYSPTSWRL